MKATFKGGVVAELKNAYLRDSFEGVFEGNLVAYSEDRLSVYRERMTRDLDGRGHPGYCLSEPQMGGVLPRIHFTLLFVKDGRFEKQAAADHGYDKLMLVVDLFVQRIDPEMSSGRFLQSVTEAIDFDAFACEIDYRNDFDRSWRVEEGLEDISRYPDRLSTDRPSTKS